jgi:hypothetical protein
VKKKLLLLMLLAGGTIFGQVSIGITIGTPPPPPRVVYVRPAPPGPEFLWVEGYWYPAGKHYQWHDGYWSRPVYAGAYWVGPRYDAGRFYEGYWEGPRGQLKHDHKWDRGRDRDYDREQKPGRGRGRGHDK